MKRVRGLRQTALSYRQQIDLIVRIINSDATQFRRVNADVISSGSNLNSQILCGLCDYLSIDVEQFRPEFDFLDKILLHRRNNIAHGQHITIDEPALTEMSDRVIGIMRMFNNAVENDVVLGAYRVTAPA